MKTQPIPQKPGCLPRGYDLDSMLTPDQFCIWMQVNRQWLQRRSYLPGVKTYSRKMVRVHPRTYLDKAFRDCDLG